MGIGNQKDWDESAMKEVDPASFQVHQRVPLGGLRSSAPLPRLCPLSAMVSLGRSCASVPRTAIRTLPNKPGSSKCPHVKPFPPYSRFVTWHVQPYPCDRRELLTVMSW